MSLFGQLVGVLNQQAGGTPPAWAPDDVSGLLRWWDASDSIIGSVTGIEDKSASGIDLEASSSASTTTIGGVQAVALSGSNKLIETGTPDALLLACVDDYTFGLVISTDTSVNTNLGLNNNSSTTRGTLINGLSTGSVRMRATNGVTQAEHTHTHDGDLVLVATWDASSGTLVSRLNGATPGATASGTARTNATSGFSVGTRSDSDTSYSALTFGEIVIYDSILSGTDLDALEAYLGAKWSISV